MLFEIQLLSTGQPFIKNKINPNTTNGKFSNPTVTTVSGVFIQDLVSNAKTAKVEVGDIFKNQQGHGT